MPLKRLSKRTLNLLSKLSVNINNFYKIYSSFIYKRDKVSFPFFPINFQRQQCRFFLPKSERRILNLFPFPSTPIFVNKNGVPPINFQRQQCRFFLDFV